MGVTMRRSFPFLAFLLAAIWASGLDCSSQADEQSAQPLPALIATDAPTAKRIDEVLVEMDRGYGGTLVTEPHDAALDSAAFVQRYLRRFAIPNALHDYSYRFERLLDRLYSFPQPLEDISLDADIWAAYRAFEVGTGGAASYKDGGVSQHLASARDVLWLYLGVNAKRITADGKRRMWWIERFCVDAALPRERLARSFAVLEMITSSHETTVTNMLRILPQNTKTLAGAAGLSWFADSLGLGWQTWGIDPQNLPHPASRRGQRRSSSVANRTGMGDRSGKLVGLPAILRGLIVRARGAAFWACERVAAN